MADFGGWVRSKNGWMWCCDYLRGIEQCLSLGYYAPMINRMYRREPSEVVQRGKAVPWVMLIPIVVLTARNSGDWHLASFREIS